MSISDKAYSTNVLIVELDQQAAFHFMIRLSLLSFGSAAFFPSKPMRVRIPLRRGRKADPHEVALRL
jgi:hypothetical protein